jgi:integrase
VLSCLFDGARRSRFIDYNPAREVKWPSMRESLSPISRALTLDQVRTLLGLIPEGAYRSYVAALVYTGMRAGEATALRVGHVDFEHGIIRVSRSLSPPDSCHFGMCGRVYVLGSLSFRASWCCGGALILGF